MNLKSALIITIILLCLRLVTHANINPAAIKNHNPAYWSVLRSRSELDSLTAVMKNNLIKSDFNALNEFRKVQLLKVQLKTEINLDLVFPASAGIYNGSWNMASLSAFDQLMLLSKNLELRGREADLLNLYAVQHALNGKLDDAVHLLHKAVAMNLKHKNLFPLRKNYLLLQWIYTIRKDFTEALKYNRAILSLDVKTQNKRLLANTYLDRSELLVKSKSFIEAENLVLTKALPLCYYGLKNEIELIRCYDQLGDNYLQQKKIIQAKWFYIQSNMLSKKINNVREITNSLINIAHVKTIAGDYELALLDLKEAETKANKNKIAYTLLQIKCGFAEVAIKMGNFKQTRVAFSEFKVMKETFIRSLD